MMSTSGQLWLFIWISSIFSFLCLRYLEPLIGRWIIWLFGVCWFVHELYFLREFNVKTVDSEWTFVLVAIFKDGIFFSDVSCSFLFVLCKMASYDGYKSCSSKIPKKKKKHNCVIRFHASIDIEVQAQYYTYYCRTG